MLSFELKLSSFRETRCMALKMMAKEARDKDSIRDSKEIWMESMQCNNVLTRFFVSLLISSLGKQKAAVMWNTW